MKTKKILASVFGAALLIAAALALHAQEPGFHHHMGMHAAGMSDEMMQRHLDFLTKALNLTADQQATAQKLHAELAAKAKPLMEQQSQQWEQIHTLLEKDNPDATEIGQQMIALHATGAQLKALHEDFMTRFSAVLTPDQLAKFQQFKEMHEREHGPLGGPEN